MSTSTSTSTSTAEVLTAARRREKLLALLRHEATRGHAEFADEVFAEVHDIVFEMEDVEDLDNISPERQAFQDRMTTTVCEALLVAMVELGLGAKMEAMLERFAQQRLECAAKFGVETETPLSAEERAALVAEWDRKKAEYDRQQAELDGGDSELETGGVQ